MTTTRLAVPLASFDDTTSTWCLHTAATTYAFRLVADDLRHVYWGPRLPAEDVAAIPPRLRSHDEVIGFELPTEGGERYAAASVQVVFADGTRAVEWRYVRHELGDDHVRIVLVDRHYPLELELSYRAVSGVDVIERGAVLRHTGDAADPEAEPIRVERLDTASWTLPPRPDYRLSHVAGEWSAEFQVRRRAAADGETTLTSRRGTTRHQTNPWLMVDAGDATETAGEVWSLALAWSGTWRITARRTYGGDLVVSAGAGQENAVRQLAAGQSITTPTCAALYSPDGFGATSRGWHAYVRSHVLPYAGETRPVLYNSWEGVKFDLDEENLGALAQRAAAMGVELFVVDDGWFGARTSDRAGLGDWWPNPDRFPGGLGPLIERVHDLGMRFGLWVEPEMVNPDSDLYRARPDWALTMANRRRTERRSQLVLNFGRPDVVEWAFGWLDRLLTEHDIAFLKWDMNRAFTEAGWPGDADAQRLWFAHTEGVYAVLDRLRAAHPGLRVETCASGGGRVDLGILARTDQAWASDNTDPVDRLTIQHGYTQLYPALTMGAWASESPNPVNGRTTPLRFRFHVAMAGALGVSGDLRAWPEHELDEAAALVARYKDLRHVVQHGELYRLSTPGPGCTAAQYVAPDRSEAVVFVWRPAVAIGRPLRGVRLQGLDPEARYADEQGATFGGAVLHAEGLPVQLPPADYASTIVRLRRV